jgi:thiol-disulfide isomerase/thioredoxin
MLRLALIFLVTVIPFSLAAQGGFNKEDSTYVSGRVKGYSTNRSEKQVSYLLHDISGKKQRFSAPINAQGEFHFAMLQDFEGDFEFQYGASLVHLYAVPGETLEVIIDNDVADKLFYFSGAYEVKGQSSAISLHMLNFFQHYLPRANEVSSSRDWKKGPSQLIEETQRHLAEDLKFLESYCAKEKAPEEFRAWARHWLQYDAASLISFIPFRIANRPAITDEQVLANLGQISIQNEEALNCSAYYEFLSRLVFSFHSNQQNQLIKDPGKRYDSALMGFDVIGRVLSGVPEQLAYLNAYLLSSLTETAAIATEPMWASFDGSINEPLVQDRLERRREEALASFTPYNVFEKLNDPQLDKRVAEDLSEIFKKEKGRYVYIDFWGIWCKPCMVEMPHYKKLIEEANGKPVSFLFLAVETSEKDVESVKEKYKIPGKFISLSREETALANRLMGFTSYPSRFLLDPEGNIISRSLTPVTNSEGLLAQLNFLMKN